MKRLLLAACACAALAGPARAATLEGVSLPDTYPVDGQTLALNGIALRTLTVFHVKVYVAGLYLQRQSHDAKQILASPGTKVILMQFLHSGTKAEIEKEFREGEKTNCGDGSCNPADAADFEKLIAASPAVKPGDTSTYIFTDRGVRVLANNAVIANFNNKSLANLLLAGFIGDHPPSPEVRSELLGNKPN